MEIAEAFRLSPSRSDKNLASVTAHPRPPPASRVSFPSNPEGAREGVAPSAGFRVSSLPIGDAVIFISSNVCFRFSCLAGSADGLEDCRGLGSSWPGCDHLAHAGCIHGLPSVPPLAPRPSSLGLQSCPLTPVGPTHQVAAPLNPRLPTVRG